MFVVFMLFCGSECSCCAFVLCCFWCCEQVGGAMFVCPCVRIAQSVPLALAFCVFESDMRSPVADRANRDAASAAAA